MSLAREVRRARSALGLSQGKYAARVGLRQQTISQLENGVRVDPVLSTVLALVNHGQMAFTPKGLRAA